jgi:hypothetical protein
MTDMTLKARTFAIGGGVIWLASQAALTWWAIRRDQSRRTSLGLDRIGRGLLTTVAGSAVGMVAAFANGFAGGWLSARTYASIDQLAKSYCNDEDSDNGGN